MDKVSRSRSIFNRILRPLIGLIVMNALIFLLVLNAAGVVSRLKQNSTDILRKQVDNRQSFLQSQMTEKWMKLDSLSEYINAQAARLIRSGALDMEELDSRPSACAPLLMSVVDRLISDMYEKQVSGIYITFNTHDLDADIAAGNYQPKTGIYIRDNDPISATSEKYADLLLECAPVSVVQSLTLSTDSGWEQKYKFSAQMPYESWLTDTYRTAAQGRLSAADCGLWSLRRTSADRMAVSYTVPLILKDGTVYGVLGVEMLPGYLDAQMPTRELDAEGVYALLVSDEPPAEDGSCRAAVYAVNDRASHFRQMDPLVLTRSRNGAYTVVQDNIVYEAALTGLTLYSRNAPFEQQRWYVMGAVPAGSLFSFTEYLQIILIITAVVMLAVGITGTLLISWHISRPIAALQKKLAAAEKNDIPDLPRTGISEIDDFTGAITSLSRDVVRSSRRFLSIMEMSSIDMGGYELDDQAGSVYMTDNFFALLGWQEALPKEITPGQFRQIMDILDTRNAVAPMGSGGNLHTVCNENGTRYIHVQERQADSHWIGVAEDVTVQVLERKRIEHERDHDILTGIYNRRAFNRDAENLLAAPEKLGTALVAMIDLDNLKILNDTYGHEWGDRYIVAGARCIRDHVPGNSIIARVSGDEFNLMLYGFRSRSEARDAVERLQRSFSEACFVLPDGKVKPIGASGGIAFVGDDTTDLKQLVKYADFAMYLVKHGRKGLIGEFDQSLYHASEIEQAKHRTFKQVIRDEKIYYLFQPIVSGRTGKICAVEALMRIDDPGIAGTEEFLRIARQENMLDEIEHLTWHHALADFHRLIQTGVLEHTTKVFVNSQVSQILSPEEQQLLIDRFGDIRENTVMEVVETDDYAVEFANLRSRAQNLFALEYALDDFGTGYNNEKNLLELMPHYVKLDMSLVRDVQKHADRQLLLRNLISFAHRQNMLVLAEGVETQEELMCLLDMDVDMFQGYLLARPTASPNVISPEAVRMIREYSGRS